MSEASRLTSPLQRQNAVHDSADSREEADASRDHPLAGSRDDADAFRDHPLADGFAEVNVADEFEPRSEAVRLLPVAGQPRRLVGADAAHRRVHSVGEREREDPRTSGDAYRKCSEGNQMSERKSLSDARGVQLSKIELIPTVESAVHRSYTAPSAMGRGNKYDGTMTETPIGFSMNEFSEPPMTANVLSTVNITVHFAYPYISLPGHKKSENAPEPHFVPVQLPIQGGKLANAEFLLGEVAKEFDVDVHYASEALAVWMVSDLLEVQLKPHHSPYGVGECWAALLRKFTSASEDDIAEDAPLVMIKRRVQLSVQREKEIMAACMRIREILFNDAYEAFMIGRYAPSVEESAELAGLALSAAFESFSPERHNVEFIRQEMESFVPRHLVSTIKGPLVFGRAINGPNSLESLLLKSWRSSPRTLAEVHTLFLEKLHDKPYYGAAFFPGSIERPKKKWSLVGGGATDIKVLVGINETFVTVQDDTKKEILLVQSIRDCTWNRIDPQPSSPPDVEPSLLLTFPDDADEKAKSTKVLQIFGRQAVMINALLSAMASLAAEDEELIEDDSGAEMSDYGGRGSNGHSDSYSNSGYSHSVPSTSRSIPVSTKAYTITSSASTSPTSSSPPKTAHSTSNPAATSGAASKSSSTVSRVPSITRHNKLCLATFDQAGVCTQAQGSLKVVFKGTTSLPTQA